VDHAVGDMDHPSIFSSDHALDNHEALHGCLWSSISTRDISKETMVYIQIEFLGLSRRVPPGFAWLVNPYTRSVPTDYLTHYIVATRKTLREASAAEQLTLPARSPLSARNRRANSREVVGLYRTRRWARCVLERGGIACVRYSYLP
jgi:hypothetical protein